MRIVVQRVTSASVAVTGEVIGEIGRGLVALVGVAIGDDVASAERMAAKVASLRLFDDADGRMNLDLAAVGGEVLAISQFTLYGDVRRGNRPSYERAASGDVAEPVYGAFCRALEERGLRCARGRFGAEMTISLVNDGPVTLVLDSETLSAPRRA